MKPAHLNNTAGQIVNEDKSIQTPSDYIKQVVTEEIAAPRKLTFEEWWDSHPEIKSIWFEEAQIVWKAAQENV